MNILIINGSPRGLKGNTGQLINVFQPVIIDPGLSCSAPAASATGVNPQDAQHTLPLFFA